MMATVRSDEQPDVVLGVDAVYPHRLRAGGGVDLHRDREPIVVIELVVRADDQPAYLNLRTADARRFAAMLRQWAGMAERARRNTRRHR